MPDFEVSTDDIERFDAAAIAPAVVQMKEKVLRDLQKARDHGNQIGIGSQYYEQQTRIHLGSGQYIHIDLSYSLSRATEWIRYLETGIFGEARRPEDV